VKNLVLFLVVFSTSISFSQQDLVKVFFANKVDTVTVCLVGSEKVQISDGSIISRDLIFGDIPEIGTILQKVNSGFVTIADQIETGFRENETIDMKGHSNDSQDYEITMQRTKTSIFLISGNSCYNSFHFLVGEKMLVLSSKIYNRTVATVKGGDSEKMSLPREIVIIDRLR